MITQLDETIDEAVEKANNGRFEEMSELELMLAEAQAMEDVSDALSVGKNDLASLRMMEMAALIYEWTIENRWEEINERE